MQARRRPAPSARRDPAARPPVRRPPQCYPTTGAHARSGRDGRPLLGAAVDERGKRRLAAQRDEVGEERGEVLAPQQADLALRTAAQITRLSTRAACSLY